MMIILNNSSNNNNRTTTTTTTITTTTTTSTTTTTTTSTSTSLASISKELTLRLWPSLRQCLAFLATGLDGVQRLQQKNCC